MSSYTKKIKKNVASNDPAVENLRKRINILVDMQISALQVKIEMLNKCKDNAKNASDMASLMKVYQDLVDMVNSDNIQVTKPGIQNNPVSTKPVVPAVQANFNL